MKNTSKIIRDIALVAMIGFSMAACDTGGGITSTQTPTTCTITTHAIDDDLSCGHSAKVYGYINLYEWNGTDEVLSGDTIPVYRTKNVTDAQMNALVATPERVPAGTPHPTLPLLNVVDRILAAYNTMPADLLKYRIISTKVNAIWVDNDNNFTDLGSNKFIIKMDFNNDAYQMKDILEHMASSVIAIYKINEVIHLVFGKIRNSISFG